LDKSHSRTLPFITKLSALNPPPGFQTRFITVRSYY